MSEKLIDGVAWIASEFCYYVGLTSAALIIPTITLMLWMMSLADKADPNYWYILIAWVFALLLFAVGVGLKNWLVSREG
jgi:uncharacterized membrane protein